MDRGWTSVREPRKKVPDAGVGGPQERAASPFDVQAAEGRLNKVRLLYQTRVTSLLQGPGGSPRSTNLWATKKSGCSRWAAGSGTAGCASTNK